MPRVCYTYRNQYRSMSQFFDKKKRCFFYHYPVNVNSYEPADNDWVNLNSINGCRYWGWVHLTDNRRGELWTYKTARHRFLLQLQLPQHRLLFHADYLRLKKELKNFKQQPRNNKIKYIPDDESFLF